MAEERTAPAAETEENPSEILRIRREKLAELRTKMVQLEEKEKAKQRKNWLINTVSRVLSKWW